MIIEKAKSDDKIESFIEEQQEAYEKAHGIECNYTPFCFVAKIAEEIVGIITGATFFSEIYIDELVVRENYRGQTIGTQLVNAVQTHYKDQGFSNINCCTNEFQAPGFYERCGFELEFVRKNKENPKLNKYFYVKHLDGANRE